MRPIIEFSELIKIFRDPNVLIFDASAGKNAKVNYEAKHIEGALFVNVDTDLSEKRSNISSGGRHPLPEIGIFEKTLVNLGISREKHIVIYDDKCGTNAAARFWWMLKSAGHEKVQVLDGGINQPNVKQFLTNANKKRIINAQEPYSITHWELPTIQIGELRQLSTNQEYIILDVRDRNRYQGKSEHIDLIAGHIPGAINFPYTENLDENGYFLAPQDLQRKYEEIFKSTCIDNIIVYCGSGVTACHTMLALNLAEIGIPKLYVGSWSEWSRHCF